MDMTKKEDDKQQRWVSMDDLKKAMRELGHTDEQTEKVVADLVKYVVKDEEEKKKE